MGACARAFVRARARSGSRTNSGRAYAWRIASCSSTLLFPPLFRDALPDFRRDRMPARSHGGPPSVWGADAAGDGEVQARRVAEQSSFRRARRRRGVRGRRIGRRGRRSRRPHNGIGAEADTRGRVFILVEIGSVPESTNSNTRRRANPPWSPTHQTIDIWSTG